MHVSQAVSVAVLAAAMGGSAIALVLSRVTGLGVGGPLLEEHPARIAFAAQVDQGADYSYGGSHSPTTTLRRSCSTMFVSKIRGTA